MSPGKIIRHIIGYVVGFSIFVVLIPLLLIKISHYDHRIGLDIFHPKILRLFIALPCIAVGLFFVLWSNVALFFIGRGGPTDGMNIAVSPRTEKLVITGPYKYSRNPMVFGAYLSYLAIGILVNSFTAVLVVAFFFALIPYYIRATEEKRLLRDFGEEFVRYRQRVRMIVPIPKKVNS